MPRVSVTAKAGCIYDGVPRPDGDEFEADLNDARLLKLIGKVEFEEPPTQTPHSTKTLKADGSPDRRYRRRDLVAEDSCKSSA